MVPWRRVVATAPAQSCLLLDVPGGRVHETMRALHALRLRPAVDWPGPERSPGATTAAPRALLRGYYDPGADAGMTGRLLLHAARTAVPHPDVYLGLSSLFANPAAMLVDVGSPGALAAHAPRLAECVWLDPRRALATVTGTLADWEEALTRQAGEHPAACVERVRWRPSAHGGRTWARPLVLDSSRRAAAQRARAGASGGASLADATTAVLLLRGPLGRDPQGILGELMRVVCGMIGSDWSHAPGTGCLRPRQWREHRVGGDWQGSVRLRFGSEQEVLRAASLLAECVVDIEGRCVRLELQTPLLGAAGPHAPQQGFQLAPFPAGAT